VVGWDDDDGRSCGSHFSDDRHLHRVTGAFDGTYTFADACVPYDPTLHTGAIFGLEELAPTEFVAVDSVVE
jgi:hypothetical protein